MKDLTVSPKLRLYWSGPTSLWNSGAGDRKCGDEKESRKSETEREKESAIYQGKKELLC